MKRLPVLSSFENEELCGRCGGNCCQQMPGAAMPADFGAGTDAFKHRVKSALASGRWAIDWWDGDPRKRRHRDEIDRAYFLRPATVGKEGTIFDPTFGGQCTFHRKDGCGIFPSRPSGCRGLEPQGVRERLMRGCTVRHSSKQDAAIAWVPHQEMLIAIAKEVESCD